MMQDQSRNRTPMPAAQPPAGAAPPEPGPARAEAGIARMLRAISARAPRPAERDLARMVVDYFGDGPMDEFLDGDIELRERARAILAAESTEPGAADAETGIARMLAGAPSSAPAQTPAARDPVDALIAEHRAAYAEWDRLSAISNQMLRSDPGFEAAEAAAAGPGKRESALLDALVAARPTTLAGIAALAEYLPGALRQVDPDEQEPDSEAALRNIAAALHALTAPRVPDPIIAGIATYRDAAAAMDAFSIRVRGRRPTAAEFAEERQLSAAQCKARDAVLAIVPSTLAGRAALVQFVRQEIDASGMADGGPPDDSHPIWRDGLRALLAAQEAEIRAAAAPSQAGTERPSHRHGASPALVAMVAKWQALLDQINGGGLSDAEVEQLGLGYDGLQRAIYDFPAASIADLLAKVPVFKDELYDAVGGLDDRFEAEDTLSGAAWLGLFRDFERLARSAPPPPAPVGDERQVADPHSPPATEPNADAALLMLVTRFEAANRSCDDADAALDAIYDAIEAAEPVRPDGLRRAGDFRHFFGVALNPESPEFYLAEEVLRLRAMTAFGHTQQKDTDAALARVAEIGAAFDEWLAACNACDAALGLHEAEARHSGLSAARKAIVTEILAVRPTTLAGLVAKARVWKYDWQAEIAASVRADLIAMGETEGRRRIDPPLTDQIIACWREWAAQPDGDESDEGKARYDRLTIQRVSLLDAAEAMPATLENVPAKALASAWLEYVALWTNGQIREDYGIDGRLVLDIDTAICGRLKTRYSGEAA